jgi:hypothetical protein
VLGEADERLQALLLQRLDALKPKELSQQQLRMLYQAHRLTTQEWLQGKPGQQQQQQGEEDAADELAAGVFAADEDGSDDEYQYEQQTDDWELQQQQQATTPFVVVIGGSGGVYADRRAAASADEAGDGQQEQQQVAVEGGLVLHDISKCSSSSSVGSSSSSVPCWPPRLLTAAKAAAAHHATTSAARAKQQQLHVQDIFEDLGYEAPVKGFRLDGGALQPDLAFVASSSKGKHSSTRGKKDSGAAEDEAAAGGLKVAIMCDHAGRYSRNAPHQLLGYETVSGWLLEQAGWRVVRMPPHEWRLLLSDRGVQDGTAMSYVYNTLAAQGVAL